MQPFPEWLEPMAASLTYERFSGPEWVFERKLDGIRVLAFKNGDDVRLLSRNRLPQNHHYPTVAAALARWPVTQVILDGEATWHGGAGAAYHVFDVLWRDGRSLTNLPLDQRHAELQQLPWNAPLSPVQRLDIPEPWENARVQGWEGVIAKRRDSIYEHKRSKNWLKMKIEAAQEFVIGGFTDPQNSRVGLGALLVGYYEGEDFVYAGKVGTGFDTTLLLQLRAQLNALEVPDKPFTRSVGLPRIRSHWVRPEIVVQVAFMEWTVHGKLRHSRLLYVRRDKPARDVVREVPL